MARGVKVGVVKRAGSGLSVCSVPVRASEKNRLTATLQIKDSARLAAAGARPSIAVGGGDVTVQFAQGQAQLLDLAAAYCGGCDLVLAEGFKQSSYDKIQLLAQDDTRDGFGHGQDARPTSGHGQDAHATLESVRLVVAPRADAARGVVGRDDIGAIREWVVAWLERRLRLGRNVMGAVMVGGQSRRMGEDKAAMQFAGRAVLPRLVELLGGRLSEVWTIGRPVDVAGMPQCVRWHLDLRAGAGPLGGIATALRIARWPSLAAASGSDGQGWPPPITEALPRAVLAVACDMPALNGDLLDFLLEHRRPGKYATVLRNGQTGFLEPLAAVYEPRILEPIEQALDAGDRSVTKLLESAGAHGIEVPAQLAGALVNVNTPDELNVLRRNAQNTVDTDDPERT